MMYPVCVRLPEEAALSMALWSVLESGVSSQAGSRGQRATSGAHRQHLDTLLQLLRAKLTHGGQSAGSMWMERRELGDLLVLVDDGLRALSRQPVSNGSFSHYHDAVHQFLREIRKQLPTPRKPLSRQASARKPVQAMVAASGR